ncbi:MAG TPA: hypothetical protein VII49_00520 [Rhizomicrobium sp.]
MPHQNGLERAEVHGVLIHKNLDPRQILEPPEPDGGRDNMFCPQTTRPQRWLVRKRDIDFDGLFPTAQQLPIEA